MNYKPKPPKEKRFEKGELVWFSYPSKLMLKAFGKRIYDATPETSSLSEERCYHNKKIKPLNQPVVITSTITNFPEEGVAMVIEVDCLLEHSSETWYYKVLLHEKLYWVAAEHLSIKRNRVKF